MQPKAPPTAPPPALEKQPEPAQRELRRPWHKPVLTEVPLQGTALASGALPDLDGQTTAPG
jgi:hypothetical protein